MSPPTSSICAVDRVIAVDWSGDRSVAGQRKKIWAGVWSSGAWRGKSTDSVTLETGRTRSELTEWLIALSRDRYWQNGGRLALDAGPFVVGLEYAASREALLVGKPSTEFFRAAVAELGRTPAEGSVAMIGDDLWADVRGAQEAGFLGWLVRTGKFRQDVLRKSGITPDRILDSVADLRPAAEALAE